MVTQLPEALAERTGIDAINRQALGSGDATLEAYAGKPVAAPFSGSVGAGRTPSMSKNSSSTKPDGHLIRKAIGAIMRTGRAAQVQVRGEAMNDGVKLTFSVVSEGSSLISESIKRHSTQTRSLAPRG